jgi:hypothetical protein
MQVYEVKQGAIVGKWEVDEKITERINGKLRTFWWCVCSCGTRKKVLEYGLYKGKSLSCGCKRNEEVAKKGTTHGMSKTTTYEVWLAMISRCYRENSDDYKNYGGRGITVYEAWKDSFEFFLVDMGEKPDGLTLERLDVDKPYEPGNCKWGTQEEQNNNKRNNFFITFNGERKTASQWAKKIGLPREVITWRLSNGWGEEKALTTPLGGKETGVYITFNGERKSIVQWAKCTGLSTTTIHRRVKNGWSEERVLTTPLAKKKKVQRKTKHGLTRTKVYGAWVSMKTRCLNKNVANFSSYGGRGIQICQLWLYSFEEFLMDMGEPGEGMSLHRIDVHGNYCPNNCRWATNREQNNNKVNSHYIMLNGESKTISQWAVKFGLMPQMIYRRIRRGKPPFSESEIRTFQGEAVEEGGI